MNAESKNYKNTHEYCKIMEIKPKDANNVPMNTNRAVMHFGSFLHRSLSSVGNYPKVVNGTGSSYISVDWPKTEFDEEKVLTQLLEYFRTNKDKEFIFSGLSFGEIIARKLFARMTEEERKRVKLYVSICGVSEREQLTLPKSVDVVKKVNKRVLDILAGVVGVVGKIDRGLFGNGPKHAAAKNAVDNSEEVINSVGVHKVLNLTRSASTGLNPGLIDRFVTILEQKAETIKKNAEIRTAILYSKNDPTFTNPKENAMKLKEIHPNSSIISLGNAGHGALVERPGNYDPILKKLIEDAWKKVDGGTEKQQERLKKKQKRTRNRANKKAKAA